LDYYVLDRTGVTDPFNFKTGQDSEGGTSDDRWIRQLDALGLKMDMVKAPAEYFVVDRAQKPRPNAPGAISEPPARAVGAGPPH